MSQEQSPPRLPWVAYSEEYVVDYPADHVFHPEVARATLEMLLARGALTHQEVFDPVPASWEQVSLVHRPAYLERLRQFARQGWSETRDTPVSEPILQGTLKATGGTIAAATLALHHRAAVNLAGGYHHAFPDHGEGFCLINDIAVAIRVLQQGCLIERAAVVDLDLHQGNGTAAIFADDPSVFTFSMHEYNNYPVVKPPSDLDIHLPSGVGDDYYLQRLQEALPQVLASDPQLVIYVAGVDPYRLDQLGGLRLTEEGLRARDEMVTGQVAERGLPLCVVMAGGYAPTVQETAQLHANTVESLATLRPRA